MTIEGEKVQAFSATSLNLPDFGDDYSQAIIDKSRAAFASSRDFVEHYVGERYLVNNKQQAQPKPTVKPGATPVVTTKAQKSPAAVITAQAVELAKPKRKRKRTRKKSTDPQIAHELTSEDTIKL
jgi:hypothetical protein